MEPQIVELGLRQLEHEIGRETIVVPLDGPDQHLGLNAIERGEVGVQHHAVAADLVDRLFDLFNRDE